MQVAATEILRVAGVPAYHTSVILGGREYYFDSQGIVSAPAFWSHLVGRAQRSSDLRTEVLHAGCSAASGASLVQHLMPFFERGSYDVLCKNCNSFTDAALYFLTRRRLDGRFCRLERVLLSTRPVSTGLLNALVWATTAARGCDGRRRKCHCRVAASDAGGSHCARRGQCDCEEGDAETGAAGRRHPNGYSVNPLASNFSIQDVIRSCDALDGELGAPSRCSKSPEGVAGSPRGRCGFLLPPCCGAPDPVDGPAEGEMGGFQVPYPFEAPLEARPVGPPRELVRRASGQGMETQRLRWPHATPTKRCPSRSQEELVIRGQEEDEIEHPVSRPGGKVAYPPLAATLLSAKPAAEVGLRGGLRKSLGLAKPISAGVLCL